METIIFHPEQDNTAIAAAAEIIRRGGLLGIPTETVYGLGADALNEDAVRRIFEAKGRPQDNPLIIHVPSADWLERYCHDVPESAYALAEKFWPGPLTMILPRRPIVPLRTTGDLETVGVRCPDHPLTLQIIEQSGVPIAAPSGNTSGRPSPTTADHMAEDMMGKIDGIVDGGACAVGVESTIIDLTVTPPRLLRPGGLPLEMLEDVLGDVEVDKAVKHKLADGEKAKAPGMKYRHYAPKAPVTVVTGAGKDSARYIKRHMTEQTGVICFDEYIPQFEGHIVHSLGAEKDKLSHAQRVFDALRTFDGTAVSEIYAQCPDESGLDLAVVNRLKKAAGFHTVEAKDQIVIGLTGGSGAGKTSALRAIEKMGGCVLDCDAIYHEMLKSNMALQQDITSAFGEVFTAEGALDRQKLGNVVFSDKLALDRLNTIIYAYISQELMARIDEANTPIVAIDAINLIESGVDKLCNFTVGIIAPIDVRVHRIMARDAISEEYARLRIGAQKNDDFYRTHCTAILENTAPTSAEFESYADSELRVMIEKAKSGGYDHE